jgi:hypothetical protein
MKIFDDSYEDIKEKGAAGIILELKDGIITVYHSEDKAILQQWIGSGDDWDTIWNTINLLAHPVKIGE